MYISYRKKHKNNNQNKSHNHKSASMAAQIQKQNQIAVMWIIKGTGMNKSSKAHKLNIHTYIEYIHTQSPIRFFVSLPIRIDL